MRIECRQVLSCGKVQPWGWPYYATEPIDEAARDFCRRHGEFYPEHTGGAFYEPLPPGEWGPVTSSFTLEDDERRLEYEDVIDDVGDA